jgi:hypothetical protein
MSRYTLTEVVPAVPDGLRCRFLLADRGQTGRVAVLVVAFDGDYPDGSLGNGHGAFIATSALQGLHAFEPDCVVLDFRGMGYRWGNTLLRVFQDISQFMDSGIEPGGVPFPVVAVTSERSRAAFLSLVTPGGGSAPSWHFDDIDAAIAHGASKAKEWLES